MNKFSILRTLNSELKYRSYTSYSGTEFALDISETSEQIEQKIRTLIEKFLIIKVKSTSENNITETIAKYGLIDITFEVETEFNSNENIGIRTLKENGWISDETSDEKLFLEFLNDILIEVKEGKTYLKINAFVNMQGENWFREKSYLTQQMIKGEQNTPLPMDQIQVFKIREICSTNYSGIWIWKYFYL